jgi:mannitol 2-dehydrogenase
MSAVVDNPRLGPQHLAELSATVGVPCYERAQVRAGIVHLGVGNFHRAHQAAYLDELLQLHGPLPWGICGVGLLPQDATMAQALLPQSCLYTLCERDGGSQCVRVIGSIVDYVHAVSAPQRVLARLQDQATRIVSLTVTESGYYVHAGRDELDIDHPHLRHDLEHPDRAPLSIYGVLATALDHRRRAGLTPFTIVSCDNLLSNGDTLRRMLASFAQLRDARLRQWIEDNVACPNSMVDRITPATSATFKDEVRRAMGGIEDAWPVMCEPFRQWVLEDRFVDGRPPFEDVGVRMTSDVAAYERMKIHMLNGSHQALSYVGTLLGYRTVDEAMRDGDVVGLVNDYMDAVRVLIEAPAGQDLRAYQHSIIARLANPAIGDTLARICFDASARIPRFVLPMIRCQLRRGGSLDVFAFILASWIRYLGGQDDAGRPIPVEDPLAPILRQAAPLGCRDPRPFLGIEQVFGEDLGRAPRLVAAVADALSSLYIAGVRGALRDRVAMRSTG